MDSKRFIKKVAAISTLAVFAFTAVPQSADAALPSTGISKQQRMEDMHRAVKQGAEREAEQKEIEWISKERDRLSTNGVAGIYIDPDKIEGMWIAKIPEDQRTPETCLKAVRENGLVLSKVPDAVMSEELCMEAVKQDACAIKFVPKRFLTSAICLESVRKNGNMLEWVPESLRTPEICKAAVMNYGEALMFVPDQLKTAELCMDAVKACKTSVVIHYVPQKYRTSELYLEAVKRDTGALVAVPQAERNADMYAIALAFAQQNKIDGMVQWLQEQIPNRMKSEVMIKATKINISKSAPEMQAVPGGFTPQERPLQ